jgi:hypothetical protein
LPLAGSPYFLICRQFLDHWLQAYDALGLYHGVARTWLNPASVRYNWTSYFLCSKSCCLFWISWL